MPLSRIIKLFLLWIGATGVAFAAQFLVFPAEFNPVIWVLWFIFSLTIVVGPVLYWYLQPEAKQTPRHDFIDLFIKFASSVLVIAGVVVAWLNFALERQKTSQSLEMSQITLVNSLEEQRSQRFVKALEALGAQSPFQRLAGVYVFKQLDEEFDREKVEEECLQLKAAGKAPEDLAALEVRWYRDKERHWAIMETLTHFIQEIKRPAPDPENPDELKALVEVHEILKYLGQRRLVYDAGEYYNASDPHHENKPKPCLSIDPADEVKRLNLLHADLRKYIFESGNFQGALFENADLTGAIFDCANLRNAIFDGADLTGAQLKNADLSFARFRNAHLEGADLTGADLTGVNLKEAIMNEETTCSNGGKPDLRADIDAPCPATAPVRTTKCRQLKRGRS